MGFWSRMKAKLDKAAQEELASRATWEDKKHSPRDVDRGADSGPDGVAPPLLPIPTPSLQQIIITDIDISFGSMIWLLIKLSFATIPAAIVVWGVYWVGVFLFGTIGAVVRP